MLRQQLLKSSSAINRHVSNNGHDDADALAEKIDAVHVGRQRALRASELSAQRRSVREADVFEARMDALHVLRQEEAFINQVDRGTLLELLSGMRNISQFGSASPLSVPEVPAMKENARLFSIRPKRAGDGVMDSGSSDQALDQLVTRTIKFAHNKQQAQQSTVLHRKPPPPPPPKLPTNPYPEREQPVRALLTRRRMSSQFSLGLVQRSAIPEPKRRVTNLRCLAQTLNDSCTLFDRPRCRLHTEQHVLAVKRAKENRELQQRVIEVKRHAKQMKEEQAKAATLIQKIVRKRSAIPQCALDDEGDSRREARLGLDLLKMPL
jgi:hypothetical protein